MSTTTPKAIVGPPGIKLARKGSTASPATTSFPAGLTRLFAFERRWVVRVFETVLPSGVDPRLPVGAADVPMRRFVDDLLAQSPLLTVIGLRLALWMVVLAPPFVLRRPRSFLGLSPADRLALLERLRRNRHYLVREMVLLFKLLGCLGFCGLPAVQRRLGIHPTDATPPSWHGPEGS